MDTPKGVNHIAEIGRNCARDETSENPAGRKPAGMTPLQGIGLFVAAYLALLARSAWKQGEIRQFLMSWLILATLFASLAAVIATYIYFKTH